MNAPRTRRSLDHPTGTPHADRGSFDLLAAVPRGARGSLARRAAPVAALAAGALVLAGCGAGGDTSSTNAAATTGTAPRSALADDVPARSAAFAETTVRPGGDAKAAIDQLKTLIGLDGRDGELARTLGMGKDGLLADGKTFQKDVLPHLGDRAAAFLLGGQPAKAGTRAVAESADGAIVAEVEDAAALRKAVGTGGRTVSVGGQELRLQGERATWIGDGVAAMGTEAAVRGVIAAVSSDKDLAGNDRFGKTMQQVSTTNPVGLAWVDLQQAPALNAAIGQLGERASTKVAALATSSKARKALPKELRDKLPSAAASKKATSGRGSLFGFGLGSLRIPASDAASAMALELAPGKLVVRSGGIGAKSTDGLKSASDAVAALPAGSWAAFAGTTSGAPAPGSAGAKALDQVTKMLGASFPESLRKALQGVEGVSGGVQGQNLLAATGAVVVRAKDEDGAKALLEQLRGVLSSKKGLSAKTEKIPGAGDGVVVGLPGLPLQIAAGTSGDRLAIGLGATSVTKALSTESRLSADPLYAQAKTALGGAAPSFVLQPAPLASLLDTLGSGLGGLLSGGGSGSDGLSGLLGGSGSGGGSSSKSGSGGSGGIGSALDLLGSDGFGRATDALGRVKLVTGAREATGSTTWRGSLVVEYDGTAEKATTKP